ncbi:Derlin-2, partial [Apophysomyces sp. BC1034]
DLLGIAVGHIYYFFEDVWPNDPASGGKRWLETPRVIKWLVPNVDDNGVEIHPEEEEEEEGEEEVEDERSADENEERPATVAADS